MERRTIDDKVEFWRDSRQEYAVFICSGCGHKVERATTKYTSEKGYVG